MCGVSVFIVYYLKKKFVCVCVCIYPSISVWVCAATELRRVRARARDWSGLPFLPSLGREGGRRISDASARGDRRGLFKNF